MGTTLGKQAQRLKPKIISVAAIVPLVGSLLIGHVAFADPTVNQYPLPESGAATSITTGPDGALWFTDYGTNSIGRMTTTGSVTEYPIPTASSEPNSIASGSDGALWFTEENGDANGIHHIGRVTTSGDFTEYALPYPDSPVGVATGPDGALWFTYTNGSGGGSGIGKITTSGSLTTYPLSNPSTSPSYITAGSDGALWFTEAGSGSIGRITTAGDVTQYPLNASSGAPAGIVSGPDGALWFTEYNYPCTSGCNIGRLTTSGALTEYALPSSDQADGALGVGPNNTLWFQWVDDAGDHLGSVTTSGQITQYNSTVSEFEVINQIVQGPDGNLWMAQNNGNIGEFAPPVTLAAPTNLTAASLTNQSPVLSWSGVSGATYYNIYRNGTLIDTISADNTTYTDNTAPEGTNSYYVTAQNDGGESGPSNSVSVYYAVLVQAINAGGSASGSFTDDTDNNGGQSYSTSASVDMSQVTAMQAPQSIYQSVRYGNSFAYTLPGLTPGASYTVRLHFSEPYWGTTLSSGVGGIGSRVFNVAVNGQAALTNFDVYKTAGGSNRAIVEDIPATADSNGNVTIQFTSDTDNAMVSGIELYDGTLPAEPAYQVQNPITSEAINAGGDAQGSYVADTSYSAGQTYSTTASVDTSGVANPAPEAVYQSVRYGNFSYELHNLAPNSTYSVQLHFSEPYYGAGSNSGGVGSRVFNVAINGTQVLTNFDVYQTAGGANKAVEQDFTAQTDANGNLVIQFTGVTNGAIVNGIDVKTTTSNKWDFGDD